MPLASDPWPLVGRDLELERVVAELTRAGSVGVVVAGPGGVGKSRLARAVLEAVQRGGDPVARVLATGSASQVPLGALAPLLTTTVEPALTLQQARNALVGLAGSGRLVLHVDDAHLLDDLSAAVVLSVAADPQVTVLVTVRTGDPRPDAVTALWKDAGATRIDLEPLGRGSIEVLLERVLGAAVSPVAIDRLTHLSSGLPLALRELVDDGRAAGRLRLEDRRWVVDDHLGVPRRLGELIGDRLDRIGDRAGDLVATLALTEPLPLAVIDELGLRAEAEALEAAEVLRVDEPIPGPPVSSSPITGLAGSSSGPSVRLAHPLYGEVALTRTGKLRRRRILSACGAAVEGLSLPEHDRLRAVLWLLWAGDEIDADRLLEAARHAYQIGDHHATAELARASWERSPSFEAGHLLGFALGRTGDVRDADAVLAAAEPLAIDDRERTLVALTRAENLQRGLGDVAAAEAHCLAAEAEVDGAGWRAEIRAHRSMILTQRGLISDALALASPVLDEPDAAPRAFVKAAYAAGIASVHAGDPDRATELALEALPRHELLWSEDVFQTEPGVHHLTTLFALIGAGRLADAQELLLIAREITRPALPRYGHGWMCFMSGLCDLTAGRVVDAAGHFDVAASIFLDGNQREVARWCRAGAATADALRGATSSAMARLEEVDELRVVGLELNEAMVDEARGWVAAGQGDRRTAAVIFAAAARSALAVGDRFHGARLLHAQGRVGEAGAVVDEVGALAAAHPGSIAVLLAEHLALFAHGTRGSEPSVEEVVLGLEQRGLVLFAGEAAAEASRRAQRVGDGRSAARWAARSVELHDRCQGARTHVGVLSEGSTPLTDRERDVARLAAERLPSKDIAARLGLSRRTVDNYLRQVYRKLGVSSRHDLPAALRDHRR